MKRLMSRLLASFKKSPKRGVALTGRRPVRLQLECLEGRELMSAAPLVVPQAAAAAAPVTLTWTGADGNLWSDAKNWSGGQIPPQPSLRAGRTD